MGEPRLQGKPTAREVVAAALIAPDGRVLLQQRRLDRRHGGLWEFPGGKVEAGETRPQALIRELAEELGIRVDAVDLHFVASSRDDEPHGVVLFLYICARWEGEPVCLDGAAIGWFACEDAQALPVPPLDLPFLAELPRWVAQALLG